MKNNRIKTALISLLCLFAAGCKKQNEKTASAYRDNLYSISQGRVVFTTASAYTHFLETASDKQKEELAAELKRQPDYTPLCRAADAHKVLLRSAERARLTLTGNPELDEEIGDLLSSPLLAGMINSDGIVQIGNYLYNSDLITDKCYALHASWLSASDGNYYYNLLLNGNVNNLYIFEFSNEDDVIQILEDNGNPVTKTGNNASLSEAARCSDGRARRRKDLGIEFLPNYNPPDFVKCKVVYQTFGFYHALFGKIKYNEGFDGHDWQVLHSYYEWKFKPRCANERVQPHVKDVIPGDGNQYKKYAWESSKRLAKFKIEFQWYLIGDLVYTQSAPHLTRVYGIQYGY